MISVVDASPRPQTNDQAKSEARARSRRKEGSRPLVLIAEDDVFLRDALGSLLRSDGLDVHLTSNGKQAMDALESGLRPDLVILDLLMPVMSGWSVWDRLQLNPALKEIP